MRRISLGGRREPDAAPDDTATGPPDDTATGPQGDTATGPQGDDAEQQRAPGVLERLRRPLAVLLALVAIFVVGWLGSALWFSPAPLLPEERTVPSVLGLPVDDARTSAERTELRLRIADRRPHPSAAPGVVIWQDPAAGTAVPMNTIVQVATSTGRPSVPVPDLVGLAARDAATVLKAAGLAVGEMDTVAAAGEPGVVLGTRPRVGTTRTAGSPVDLIVTAGDPPERTVP